MSEVLDNARTLVKSGRFDEALAALATAPKDGREGAEGSYLVGFCHLNLGRPAEAVLHLGQAMHMGFSPYWSLLNLGAASQALGQFGEAAAYLVTANSLLSSQDVRNALMKAAPKVDLAFIQNFDSSIRYRNDFKKAFGCGPPPQQSWLNATFEYHTPEGMHIGRAMLEVEAKKEEELLRILKAENVPGAIAEFGVFRGEVLKRLIDSAERVGVDRDVYGFDSFEGLPKPSEFDPDCWKEGDYAEDLDRVAAFLESNRRPKLKLIKGWYKESLRTPQARAIEKYAYVRVDCDLYESTLDVMQHLDGRLSNGAVVVFDDWTGDSFTGETRGFFEWYKGVEAKYRFESLFLISIGHLYTRVWLN